MGIRDMKPGLSAMHSLKNNAVLNLVLFSAVTYLMLAISWAIIMIVFRGDGTNFSQYFIPNIALGHVADFPSHWWTLFIYGIFQVPNSFFELLSNMLWLYTFGSVVQMLVGGRQVVPLYVYSLILGGIFYLLAQLLPGKLGIAPPVLMGGRAGIVGMAAAAFTLAPGYRFYFTETFSLPITTVFGVFAALMLLSSGLNLPVVILMAGGGLTGMLYVRMLRSGYRPSEWIYSTISKVESLVTPSEKVNAAGRRSAGRTRSLSNQVSQSRVDEILDKINQKGYNSLSKEEREILFNAGKQ